MDVEFLLLSNLHDMAFLIFLGTTMHTMQGLDVLEEVGSNRSDLG